MSPPDKPASAGAAPRALSPARRRLFISLVLIALASVQELAFRALFPLPECAGFNRMTYTPVEFYGDDSRAASKRGLSNAILHMESEPDGFSLNHTLNLYGFRGPNFSLDPPADRPRIVFIGDSFTEGAGAGDQDTIPEQFSRILESRQSVEAVNLGISGTGFAYYCHLARDSVPLLKPQAVFVVACFNDIPTDPLSEFKLLSLPATNFPRHRPWAPRALAALSRWWAGEVVPGRWLSGPYHIHAAVPSPGNPLSGVEPPGNVDAQILNAMRLGKTNPWNLVMAAEHERALRFDYSNGGGAWDYLGYLAKLCDKERSKLILVYIPHQVTANPIYMQAQVRMGADYGKLRRLDGPEHRAQQRHFRQVTQDLGIPFLDTTDEFIEAEKTGRMYWPVDGHCTAAGYRLVADVCARYWLDGMMPRAAALTGAAAR